MTDNTKFIVGRTYTDRSSCDWDCVYSFTITKRTAKFITFTEHGKETTRGVYTYDGVEACRPHGTYSMCAVIRADRFVEEAGKPVATAKAVDALKAQAKHVVEVIDLTPTWEEVVACCIAILERSSDPVSLATAREELFKAGRLADAYVALQKARKPA